MNPYEKIYELLPNEYRVIGEEDDNSKTFLFISDRGWWGYDAVYEDGNVYPFYICPTAAHAIIETLARRYLARIFIDCEDLDTTQHLMEYFEYTIPPAEITLSAVKTAREWEDKKND